MIGIHDRSGSFSDRWIQYCTEHAVPFRRVNCLASDAVAQCADLDAVLWHWTQNSPAELLVARQIIASLEAKGLAVFPNVRTCWHFDDKVAQKYLLEAINAPLIPTWVFTNEAEAVRWCEQTSWPKVFKLRCGSSSDNVRLVRSKGQALALCLQAFGRGFPAVAGYLTDMPTRLRRAKTAHALWERIARAPRTLLNLLALRRQMPRQRGYILFQDFLPGNDFDTRITIIGKRAFGFMRANRPHDFRASGSGLIDYDRIMLDKRCVEIAFKVTDQLGTQSLAFDFLFNSSHEPMISEISYGYVPALLHACQGQWDRSGAWHPGHVWPQDAIIEDLLGDCRQTPQAA
jgi:glutathione synthase/RimK-type ligase-like ATP-grasp enzyme